MSNFQNPRSFPENLETSRIYNGFRVKIPEAFPDGLESIRVPFRRESMQAFVRSFSTFVSGLLRASGHPPRKIYGDG